MKTCGKCLKLKPLSQFNRHCRAPDGLHWWRKDCKAAAAIEYTARVKKDPARCETWRQWQRKADRKYQRQNLEKGRAHAAVKYHKDRGNLVPQPCEVCGSENVQAHHEDYSKQLDVNWLCPKHHAGLHRGVVQLEGAGEGG